MSYFPLFIDLKNKKVLIIGAGKIARHKIDLLKEFEADITCISKDKEEIENVRLIQKNVEKEDIKDFFLVIAATSDKRLNHEIASWCKEKNIFVNVVDQKEDCTFIFPSLIKKDEIVAAFSSSSTNPIICSYLKKKNQEIINDKLINANKKLSAKRKELMNIDYSQRKEILEKLLEEYLSE